MKSLSSRPVLSRFAANALLLVVLASAPAFAQDVSKNSILQNKADQQDLRQHTTGLADQIQSLIDELSENGISGEDAKVLTTTKAVLSNLSAEEMQRVLASLQKAGDNAGTQAGEQNLVDAYGTQKSIILEFRQILKDYEQRQAADVLPAKFKDLTDRQTQIMWTTAQVATDSAGKGQQELNTLQQTTAQIVQTDQNSLVSDLAMAKQMLDKAAPSATGDQGQAMQQAEKDLADGRMQAALDKATADLSAGHLLQATADQKAARDMLRQVAKDLSPPTTTADALAGSAASLQKIIDAQKDLLTQTNAAVGVNPRVTGLDEKQGIIVDQTNSLQQDMQAMSPDTAGLVKNAITPMQIARADLTPHGGQFFAAASSEQDALTVLEQASQQLNQQVADAQKAADDAAKDSTAKLQQLQQQIQQAQQSQQQLAQTTTQAANNPSALSQAQQQQGQLQQTTQNLQQTASPMSLPASQALANAQQAMQQAQQSMGNPAQPQQAQQAQQQAAQDLQQANQAVQQAIAQNQQQTTDPAQLAQAADQLQQAQTDVSNAMADAQQQQSSPQQPGSQPQPNPPQSNPPQPGSKPNSPQANSTPSNQPSPPTGAKPGTPSMEQARQALAQAAQATQAAAGTPGLPQAAQGAIQSAQHDIAQGQQSATQGNAPATASAAAAAQASLAQAQAAVAVAQAGMTPSPSVADGSKPGDKPTPPGPDQHSINGAQTITGGSTDKGQMHDVAGNGKFITVMSRERAAITETQGETRPQEYSPMIDQYLKNLSDQATASPSQ